MTVATPCVHRWRIDEPNGPLSNGVCSLCGAERQFANAEELLDVRAIQSRRAKDPRRKKAVA